MKKVISVISIVFVFLILYFLQENFFSWFTIYGIKPNLFLIFVAVIGLFLGKDYGFGLGVIFGLFLDLFSSGIIGITSIVLGAVGGLAGVLEKNFSRDHRLTFLLIITILTIIGEVLFYLITIVINKAGIQIREFTIILLIEILYNNLITIIFYPLIQNSGKALINGLLENKKVFKG